MSLAEGVARSIVYKAYATGVISANTQPVSTVDPAVGSAKILRRVSSTLKLAKDTYQSAEIRSDRQIQDFRHGVKRVTGSISGELSPATYWDFFEAVCRGTKSSAVSLSQADVTDIVSDSSTSTFTVSSGNPVTLGIRTGDILRFASLSTAANNATNFLVTGFSTANNRTIHVYPAPTTNAVADNAFTVTTNGTSGKAVYVPSSSFVSRKFGFEINSSEIDVSQLYTECRIGSVAVSLPATGMGTIEVGVMGRDMEIYEDGAAPFYTSPTAATTTGCIAAVNGLLRVGGSTVGVVTGLSINMDLSPSSDAVVGQNFVPEIFLGRANVTGQMTAFLQDATFLENFKDEDEISVLAYMTTSSAVNSPALSIYLPRLKLGDADVGTTGEGGQQITMPFQALKADGLTAGDDATTIRFVDTEAA
jgi:hypothetical protein